MGPVKYGTNKRIEPLLSGFPLSGLDCILLGTQGWKSYGDIDEKWLRNRSNPSMLEGAAADTTESAAADHDDVIFAYPVGAAAAASGTQD